MAATCLAVLAVGCAPVEDPSAGMPVAEVLRFIDRVPHSERTPGEFAEAFAHNLRSRDVQRDVLRGKFGGRSVEWEIPVYDVGCPDGYRATPARRRPSRCEIPVYDVDCPDGRCILTSQTIPVTNAEAVPLLRVQAPVLPRSEDGHAFLHAVRTGDSIRLREKIRVRALVAMASAVAVRNREGGSSPISRYSHD